MDVSPKRRVLAALDPNASSPKPRLGLKPGHVPLASPLKQPVFSAGSPDTEPRKRLTVMDDEFADQPAKKVRVMSGNLSVTRPSPAPSSQSTAEEVRESQRKLRAFVVGRNSKLTIIVSRQQSTRQPSPAASSIFDSSLLDTSQATTLTEPDAESPGTTAGGPATTLRAITLPPPRPRMTREQAREVCLFPPATSRTRSLLRSTASVNGRGP